MTIGHDPVEGCPQVIYDLVEFYYTWSGFLIILLTECFQISFFILCEQILLTNFCTLIQNKEISFSQKINFVCYFIKIITNVRFLKKCLNFLNLTFFIFWNSKDFESLKLTKIKEKKINEIFQIFFEQRQSIHWFCDFEIICFRFWKNQSFLKWCLWNQTERFHLGGNKKNQK